MDDTYCRKKLREAKFFLSHMSNTTSTIVQEPEHLKFYLSAFISAARSVTFTMQKENKDLYDQLFPNGNFQLNKDDEKICKFMVDCRDEVVKRTGEINSKNIPDEIEINCEYRDKSSIITVASPPGVPPVKQLKPRYYWLRDDKDYDVIDDCRRYVGILERIVDRFEMQVETND